VTQPDHSTQHDADEADDDGFFPVGEIAAAFGDHVADNPFSEIWGRSPLEAHVFDGTIVPLNPHWPDRLPTGAYRLIAWLGVGALPEHDAALAISKLSRRALVDDEFGARTLDLVDEWLGKFGRALEE
jgi:hypothetical protein